MPADDVTLCEPDPPISEAPMPTPEDWVRLYELANSVCQWRYSSIKGVMAERHEALDSELSRMRPTCLRLKANDEDLR